MRNVKGRKEETQDQSKWLNLIHREDLVWASI